MIRSNTSASNFHRRVGCLASARIEKDLAEVSGPDAVKGTELHKLWANPNLPRHHLEDKDREAIEAVEKMTREFDQSLGVFHPKPQWEQEYPLFRGTAHRMNNHPDRVLYYTTNNDDSLIAGVAIVDAKFGRLEVDAAEDNWQLGVYFASVLETMEAEYPGQDFVVEFHGAILQPWVSITVKPVRMSMAEVRELRTEIWNYCERGLDPNAAYNPTPSNCRYCKGALHGVCPAQRDFALAPVKDSTAVEKIVADAEGYLLSLEPDKRTQILDAFSMAVTLNDKIRPAARALLAKDKEAIPGYSVGKETEMRKITDVIGLVSHLQARGASATDVWNAATISISAAEKLVKKVTNLKGEELAAEAKKTLRPFVDVTPRAGNLERQ